jgi:hypothetical protein
VVTFAHWRLIFWVQVAMAGLGLVLSLLFVPGIEKREGEGVERHPSSVRDVLAMFNPVRIFRQWLYPNVLLCVCILQARKLTRRKRLKEIGCNVWPPRHLPVRSPHLRPRDLQPPLQPHLGPRQRPLLPRPRRGIPPGEYRRRKTI